MNKLIILGILGLLIVSMVGVVSADTLIAGKIYNADYSDIIEGADVIVTCNNHVQDTVSLDDGAYRVVYEESGDSACSYGDFLSVSATYGDLSGYKEGEIHENAFDDWDLAIVNVPLVPEFGLIIGLLTMLGAVGAFFVIRRK